MSDTIQERLRAIARQRAEDRVVAEFGPGGGNPNAVPQDHIEWEAADEIDRLHAELDDSRQDATQVRGENNLLHQRWCKAVEENGGLRAELAEKDKRIEELTRGVSPYCSGWHFSTDQIDAAWKMGMEEHRLFGTRHILGVLEKLGIVPCEKCGGTKRAHPPETRCSETECDCPNSGWVVRGKP